MTDLHSRLLAILKEPDRYDQVMVVGDLPTTPEQIRECLAHKNARHCLASILKMIAEDKQVYVYLNLTPDEIAEKMKSGGLGWAFETAFRKALLSIMPEEK